MVDFEYFVVFYGRKLCDFLMTPPISYIFIAVLSLFVFKAIKSLTHLGIR